MFCKSRITAVLTLQNWGNRRLPRELIGLIIEQFVGKKCDHYHYPSTTDGYPIPRFIHKVSIQTHPYEKATTLGRLMDGFMDHTDMINPRCGYTDMLNGSAYPYLSHIFESNSLYRESILFWMLCNSFNKHPLVGQKATWESLGVVKNLPKLRRLGAGPAEALVAFDKIIDCPALSFGPPPKNTTSMIDNDDALDMYRLWYRNEDLLVQTMERVVKKNLEEFRNERYGTIKQDTKDMVITRKTDVDVRLPFRILPTRHVRVHNGYHAVRANCDTHMSVIENCVPTLTGSQFHFCLRFLFKCTREWDIEMYGLRSSSESYRCILTKHEYLVRAMKTVNEGMMRRFVFGPRAIQSGLVVNMTRIYQMMRIDRVRQAYPQYVNKYPFYFSKLLNAHFNIGGKHNELILANLVAYFLPPPQKRKGTTTAEQAGKRRKIEVQDTTQRAAQA